GQVVGLYGKRLAETDDGLDDVARFEQRVAEACVGVRTARIQLRGLFIEGERFAAIPLLPQRVAEVGERLRVAGVELERLAVAGDRGGELPLGRQTQAEVVVRHRQFGCERGRVPAARLGLRQLA